MDPEQIPLRDLHLPPDPGWWPLAPGWWALIALAAGVAGWYAWLALQRWRADRARRIALRELGWIARQYEQKGDAVHLAQELSELLRRALLAYAPRAVVAGLTGERWLAWLDRGLQEPVFTSGPGRSIATLPYREPGAVGAGVDAKALIDAVRLRLQTPLPEGPA
ncbi:MAG: DUF4381 domain-containing protein [Woeseiaceae bacterium]|nr:DUF4381 domain-containing protein [Woeseiaceae bacterium]